MDASQAVGGDSELIALGHQTPQRLVRLCFPTAQGIGRGARPEGQLPVATQLSPHAPFEHRLFPAKGVVGGPETGVRPRVGRRTTLHRV